ncbi:protein Wiz-like isoform X2 [Ornithorhynchus anatinus]|uniref:protein Wiz-like isoform X2 n=1 Tax=Ornithorhynchus anatinus TaxID=9258 RepID=UPI0010A8758F|nr:protein Wiz-like isoform X2 [Ornithorhynchus anatinus]
MEKCGRSPASEWPRERQGEGTPGPAPLECSRGLERISSLAQATGTLVESEDGTEAGEGEGDSQQGAAFYPTGSPGALSVEGPLETGEPCVGSSFSLDSSLDAEGPPHPVPGGALPATIHRKSNCSQEGGSAEFQKGSLLLQSRFPGLADGRSSRVSSGSLSWECSLRDMRGDTTREESTLERLPGSREPLSSKEASFMGESPSVNTVKMNPELEGESELLGPREAPAETCSVSGSREDRHAHTEPKQHEAFHKEHLEKSKKGIQRFDWISDPGEGPHYKEKSKTVEAGGGGSIRAQALIEVPPQLTLPVFRKTVAPSGSKTQTMEVVPAPQRKGPSVVDSELTELGPLGAPEWTLQKAGLQPGPELAIGKQSWMVNAEDSVERVQPGSLEATSCGAYDLELRPYVCDVLLEDPVKEDLAQEEDPTVYTCIECSIYFKKKEHLLEHMMQHSRGPGQDPEGESLAGQCPFSCSECGWAFGDPGSLEQHRRLHQESREKIIEEIQKLNEFPDEGREARLQCPKCVFGTNSSKIFVQHAKMHVKERKDQGAKPLSLFGSASEVRESSGPPMYRHFKPSELGPALVQPPGGGRGLGACVLCGFPAPSESILKEHMKYAHSHPSWDAEAFEEDPDRPGTSRDTYSSARLVRFPETDYFSKGDRLFAPARRDTSSAPYDPARGFVPGHQRQEKNSGGKKDYPAAGFQAKKMAPFSSAHRNLGMSACSSAKVYARYSLPQGKKTSTVLLKEVEGEGFRAPPGGLEELRSPWATTHDFGNMEEEISLTTEIDLTENRSFKPFVIPQSALDLKRTFRDILKATESSEALGAQQQQLRKMLPIVLLEEINLRPKKSKPRPKSQIFKKRGAVPTKEFVMDEALPLDILLLEPPLEGPLGIDDLFDVDSPMLKNEERKCPYCPDRFHNGIGLANHVRGHLNRVGVSYNVRHFISAEEVKAIEQKFSFQKKKKKVANFDPSTFSLMRCEFCGAGFDTRAGLSSHARAHLRDFGITNWELTISPINILKELLANSAERPALPPVAEGEPASPSREREALGFDPKSLTPMSEGSMPRSPLSPYPPAWGDESVQSYRDGKGCWYAELFAGRRRKGEES